MNKRKLYKYTLLSWIFHTEEKCEYRINGDLARRKGMKDEDTDTCKL